MRHEGGAPQPRLVVGLLIMALGSLFLLDNLDVVDFDDAFRFWPLALVAIGVTVAMQPGGGPNRAFGAFLIVAGAWILLYDFDLVPISFWDAWPVVLIFLGAWLVWRSLDGSAAEQSAGAPAAGAPVAADGSDTLGGFGFLNGVVRTSSSRAFRAADATAIMGGCTIDLRGADLGPEPAVVDAFAFWGGIDVLVPKNWTVMIEVLPLLGGVENETQQAPDPAKQILVRGTALMGGVRVANEPSPRD